MKYVIFSIFFINFFNLVAMKNNDYYKVRKAESADRITYSELQDLEKGPRLISQYFKSENLYLSYEEYGEWGGDSFAYPQRNCGQETTKEVFLTLQRRYESQQKEKAEAKENNKKS